MSILSKMYDTYIRVLNHSATMAIIGVLTGGLITGYFNLKTQEAILFAQHRQFKDTYLLEKNNILKKDVAVFVDKLSRLIVEDKSKIEMDSLISIMVSISLKISLTEDYVIGGKCLDLTSSLRNAYVNGQVNDPNFQIKINEWMKAVGIEMKSVDYSIDEDAVNKHMKQALLGSGNKN